MCLGQNEKTQSVVPHLPFTLVLTITLHCGPIYSCSPAPPPYAPPIGHVWGDPHFEGFDGVLFSYQGTPGTRHTLFKDADGDLITSVFVRAPNTPKDTTVVGEVSFDINGDKFTATLWRENGTRKMNVTIGTGAPFTPSEPKKKFNLAGGVTVTTGVDLEPPYYMLVTSDRISALVTLRPPSAQQTYTNGLNFYMTVLKPLSAPVTGLLGDTYKPAATARAAVFPLSASVN